MTALRWVLLWLALTPASAFLWAGVCRVAKRGHPDPVDDTYQTASALLTPDAPSLPDERLDIDRYVPAVPTPEPPPAGVVPDLWADALMTHRLHPGLVDQLVDQIHTYLKERTP